MNINFAFYWRLLIRRMPVMMAMVLATASIGTITALRLPETWSSSARLLVEEPQIPDEMVRSTIQTDAVEQLDIIQEKLLTRGNLIDIANRFDVFDDLRRMEPDKVERAMREGTTIRRSAGRNQAVVLNIVFRGRSGQIASNVVNEYVTIILDENTSFRVSRAESTLRFFEQEVRRMEDQLSARSLEITNFKNENVGALPENQSYRLGRQTLLQERQDRLEREKSVLEAQQQDLQELFDRTGRVSTANETVPLSRTARRLEDVNSQLTQALSIYSDSHPSIIRLRALVTRLEDEVAQETLAPQPEGGEDIPLEQLQLNTALSEIRNRLEFVLRDIDGTKQELTSIGEAIARSSSNGIALNALEREYEVAEARYNTAVQNLNTARMSERVETTAQGRRITVIESANVPTVPTGPNRPQIAAAGVAVGLVLAGLYFFLLEILNRTIRRPEELVSRFNVTPIATIPYMESRRHRMLRRAGILSATILVIICVPGALWYVDANYIPLEVLVQQGLDRLGIG